MRGTSLIQESTSPYFGAIVGRCANRIAEGTFTVDGKTHNLAINNPPNALHGGNAGFDKRIWTANEFTTAEGDDGVRLSRTSKDGEEVSTQYSLRRCVVRPEALALAVLA